MGVALPRAVPRRRRADAAQPLQGDAAPPSGLAGRLDRHGHRRGARDARAAARAGRRRRRHERAQGEHAAPADRRRVPAAPAETTRLAVTFQSFGFKHGPPRDADLVFDVRFLPNPHWEPALRELTGHDTPRPGVRRAAGGKLEEFYDGSSRCWTSCSRSTRRRARRTWPSRSAAPAGGTGPSRDRRAHARRRATGRTTTSGSRSPHRRRHEGPRAGLS